MAPEAAFARGAGPETDLYAVGILAGRMLAAASSFDGPNGYEVLAGPRCTTRCRR
ncbi:MAG: hypothetical protein R3F60_24295 [bacterium]